MRANNGNGRCCWGEDRILAQNQVSILFKFLVLSKMYIFFLFNVTSSLSRQNGSFNLFIYQNFAKMPYRELRPIKNPKQRSTVQPEQHAKLKALI